MDDRCHHRIDGDYRPPSPVSKCGTMASFTRTSPVRSAGDGCIALGGLFRFLAMLAIARDLDFIYNIIEAQNLPHFS